MGVAGAAGTGLMSGMGTNTALMGLSAASAAYQGFRGSQQNSLFRENARITEGNIPYVRAAAQEKARQLQVASYLMQGRQKAGYAASGLAVGGSVFDVMHDTAMNYTRDASFAILEGELQARGMQRQAELFRIQGRNTMRDAIIGGGLNLLSTGIWANSLKQDSGVGGTSVLGRSTQNMQAMRLFGPMSIGSTYP